MSNRLYPDAPRTIDGKYNSSGNLVFTRGQSGQSVEYGQTGGSNNLDFKLWGSTASAFMLWDESADALLISGDARIDLSNATIASGNTDGGVMKAGTSGSRVVEDTASMKFISFYWDNGATSGDSQGIYNRLYITGAGGGGDALRSFCTVENVAGATARGAHISLSFGASGSVTGLGAALETTLHMPSGGGMAGTVSSIKAAINADAAGSDPAGASISVFNVVAQGTQAGIDDLDDDCVLFNFQGWAVDTAAMLYDNTGTDPTNSDGSIRIRLPSGALAYLMYYNQQAA